MSITNGIDRQKEAQILTIMRIWTSLAFLITVFRKAAVLHQDKVGLQEVGRLPVLLVLHSEGLVAHRPGCILAVLAIGNLQPAVVFLLVHVYARADEDVAEALHLRQSVN